jgi:hypothetical protein
MTQFTTVADLRSALTTLLAADLGTFGNGIPRIWVKPPDPPAGTASGLECIIQRVPEGMPKGSSGRQKYYPRRWIVTLTNYADDGSMANAAQKIHSSEDLVFYREPRITPATDKNYESIKFYLFDPILINS